MLKRFGFLSVAALLAVVILAACGSEDNKTEPTVTRIAATGAPAEPSPTTAGAAATTAPGKASPIASPGVGKSSPVAGSSSAGKASPVATKPAVVTSPVAATHETPASPVAATPEPTNAPVTAASLAVSPQASPAARGTTLELSLEDIKFSTKTLDGPANAEITVKLTNKGAAVHNFNIDALNVHSGDLQPGESKTVTVKGAAGEYQYYCNIPGHKEAGMVGTLTLK